jgi:uncharacterized SAM-binding protein YcdF (DUF218 family)
VLKKLLIGLAVLGLVWLGFAVALFLFPQEDHPTKADAVIVLSGDRHQRFDRALQLMRAGVSKTLVVSGWPDELYPQARRYCAHPSAYRVICFWPKPFSTRGEAREIETLARRYGWKRVVVVSSTYHLFRARMLIERCYHGKLDMVGAPFPGWRIPLVLVEETAKLAVALTARRGC